VREHFPWYVAPAAIRPYTRGGDADSDGPVDLGGDDKYHIARGNANVPWEGGGASNTTGDNVTSATHVAGTTVSTAAARARKYVPGPAPARLENEENATASSLR
jgi:hypothetical protein